VEETLSIHHQKRKTERRVTPLVDLQARHLYQSKASNIPSNLHVLGTVQRENLHLKQHRIQPLEEKRNSEGRPESLPSRRTPAASPGFQSMKQNEPNF
jgi:hypothetical protein